MECADLLSLPVEVLHHISTFLTVRDVLACSLTCHYLRTVLNDNAVWRRYLPEKDVSCLSSLDQRVPPALRIDESLTPLCANRAHFIRRTRVVNNWRDERFVDYHSEMSYHHFAEDYLHPNTLFKLYDNRYVFLGHFNSFVHEIEVWDINSAPVLYDLIDMKDKWCSGFHIIGSYLVGYVYRCRQILVYQITLPEKEFPLLYSFLVTERDVHNLDGHSGECGDPSCVGWEHTCTGQYLLSNKCGESTLHIWDIGSASKVGAFDAPLAGCSVTLHSFKGNQLVLSQFVDSTSDKCYFYFNIDSRKFSDSVFKYNGSMLHIMFHKSYALVFKDLEKRYGFYCVLYEFNTSLKIKGRSFITGQRNNKLRSTSIVNGSFVILCSDGFHIVDALTLQTLDCFSCDDDIFIFKQLNILGSVFVMSCNSGHNVQLWDIKNKRKIPGALNLCYLTPQIMNDVGSILVCLDFNNITVYHFW